MNAWMLDNSLWIAALGLMLASSGIDGAYLSKMMEPRLWVLGYVLNTMSDISGMIIMYWFGRLRQERKGSKRYRLAIALLPAELVTVAYSWFFSWRQLITVLPTTEGLAAQWVAPIAAGFIPLLLAFIGWGQALKAGRFLEPMAEIVATMPHKDDKPDIPPYIVGQLPDTKWTEADFVRLISTPVSLTPAMCLEIARIADVHPRTVGRWQDRANGKVTSRRHNKQEMWEDVLNGR